MSRSAPTPKPSTAQKRRFRLFALPWYGLCIPLLSSGCFFFLPFEIEEDNVAPEIVISVPDEGQTLVMDRDPWLPYVIAEDADNDPLVCEWYIDSFGQIGAGDAAVNDGRYACTYSLSRDVNYDGHTLTVYIFDPSNDFDSRSWLLEVPSEAR